MTLQAQLSQAVQDWVASSGSEDKEQVVFGLLEKPEISALPYVQRNAPFLTASKLKEFQACAYHAKLRYIDQIDMGFDQEDYFTVGTAIDARLTYGDEAYQSRYAAVKIRNDKAAAENPGKTLLTNTQATIIDQAVKEYRSRSNLFPQQPRKKNVLFLLHGVPCKAELDHFSEEDSMIEDTKTTASIVTFDPHFYDLQATFYALGVEKRYGVGCQVALNVLDKHTNWSRSHRWVFSRSTLQAKYYEVENLVQQWRDSVETGLFPHVDPNTEEGLKTCWSSEFWSTCPFCRTASPTIL